MHLLLRADSDASIGTGHVMRSLALGRRWIAAGGSASLLGSIESERLRQRIAEAGVALLPLDVGGAGADVEQTVGNLERLRNDAGDPPWVVLDGYRFDTDYHQTIRRRGFPLLVMDDLADRESYHADLVVNQNLGAEEMQYRGDADTRWLLGTRYALLQPEFDKWSDRAMESAKVARRILVTVGGADPGGATGVILEALNAVQIDELELTVVVGPAAGRSVEEAVGTCRHACAVLDDARDMASVMASMDLAITGAGTTCWELAFMGLPAIVIELSDNQRGSARALAAAGAVDNAGPADALDAGALTARINNLCRDGDRRSAMAEIGRRLVDGKGGTRVVRRLGLGLPPLTLRRAAHQDASAVLAVSNDPLVRCQSFNSAPISWETHAAWFARILAPGDARMWVLAAETGLAGQVRYELTGEGDAEIGISIAPAFRGFGLAARLLASTWAHACRELGAVRARGVVMATNRASSDAFREAGFEQAGEPSVIEGRECHVFTRTLQQE